MKSRYWSKIIGSLLITTLSLLSVGPGPDDDGGDDGRGGGWGSNTSRDEIQEWWQEFQKKFNYPLYCLILASTADAEVASFVQAHRPELETIAGKDCCLIFFRDLDRRKLLEPFQFAEHTKRVYTLAKFIGLNPDKLPCLLFFEQFGSGKYIHLSLASLSEQELLVYIRRVFSYLYNQRNPNYFKSLKSFQHSQALQSSSSVLFHNAVQIGRDVLVEFFKSLIALK